MTRASHPNTSPEEGELLLLNSRHSQRDTPGAEERRPLRSSDMLDEDLNISSGSESHFSDAEDADVPLEPHTRTPGTRPASSLTSTATGTASPTNTSSSPTNASSSSPHTSAAGASPGNSTGGRSQPQSSAPNQNPENHLYPSLNTVEGSLAQIPNSVTPEELELQTRAPAPAPVLSYRQRFVNTVHSFFSFRQTYDRLSNGITTGRLQANTPGRFIGLGTDGVFRNLAAKPDRELEILSRELHPPTYEEAAADASPEYWEIGVVNPVFEDEVFVRGLPVGTFGNLLWNAIMTIAFKMVAFVLCYLLHTSHAAKEGTRVGFGAMLIMYGYNILPTNFGSPDRIPPRLIPESASAFVLGKTLSLKISGALDTYVLDIAKLPHNTSPSFGRKHEPYMAYGIIAFGIFTILQAFVSFYQVKQDERQMLAPPPEQPHHSNTEAVYDIPE